MYLRLYAFLAFWSASSPGTFLIAKNAKFLHADNEDSEAQADLSLRWPNISEGTFSHKRHQFIVYVQVLLG